MTKRLSVCALLKAGHFPKRPEHEEDRHELKELQLKLLRIQQSVFHRQQRVIIVFEGFDAAGKGGVIRRLTEALDPRGIRVHPIGPPKPDEQARHYLYRFWQCLPEPGTIAVFDRSWYGRVLVEKVEALAPKKRLREAYDEINAFEKLLTNDGIHLIKFFLAVDAKEQLRRFRDRLNDPYKRWKITPDDLQARKHWAKYVDAADEMLSRTDRPGARWHLVPAHDKHHARLACLGILARELREFERWLESNAARHEQKKLRGKLDKLARRT